ncbi:unnamed protein product [Callosobruchus maculatus]|uniref:HTH OST-type domain-containing protein n=1 Tax=Callosobruchus maculatus TaxID=64391 RepID=A0A653DCV1_CALMS|nr:unnamed protein product [Callosobruchus maculatus]
MVLGDYQNTEEEKIYKILLSIICLYCEDGLLLDHVDEEFKKICGESIPYKKFGASSLRSWLVTLPEIYIVRDLYNREVLIQQSKKSMHIKEMILKQKKCAGKVPHVRNDFRNYNFYQRKKGYHQRPLPEGSFVHASINNPAVNDYEKFSTFCKLECMLPLFYKHQALGDDFFLDIADNKLGYYVPDTGIKQCGLCVSGQTIAQLLQRVKESEMIAPRVIVMIGFQDLLMGNNINNMIYDLKQLITELKNKNARVTLVTIPPSPKLPNSRKIRDRLCIYNQAIMDYSWSSDLKCNVIDMHRIFHQEQSTFRRDFDRLSKVAKNDQYKVFSDYGRKIFLTTLKTCLKEQLEAGH